MARLRYNDDSGDQFRDIGPFWLRQDYQGRDLVDERVLTVAKDNWRWAIRLVSKCLHDAPQTPAIIESVAVDVTKRLRESPEVGRKLNAYFRTALITGCSRSRLGITEFRTGALASISTLYTVPLHRTSAKCSRIE